MSIFRRTPAVTNPSHPQPPADSWTQWTDLLAVNLAIAATDDAVNIGTPNGLGLSWMQSHNGITINNNGHRLPPRTTTAMKTAGWYPDPPGDHPLYYDLPWNPTPDGFLTMARFMTGFLTRVIGAPSPDSLTSECFNTITQERFLLATEGTHLLHAQADAELRHADLRMTQSITDLVRDHLHPGARILSTPTYASDRRPIAADAGEFYREAILFVPGPRPHLHVYIHTGPSGRIRTQFVPNPAGGRPLHVEAGCSEYIRNLLTTDPGLAAFLTTNPGLRRTITTLLATGEHPTVAATLVRHDTVPNVTSEALTLNPDVVQPRTLTLASLR